MKSKFLLYIPTLSMLFHGTQAEACRMARPIPDVADELVSFNSCLELENHVAGLQGSRQTISWEGARAATKQEKAKEVSSDRAENFATPSSPAAKISAQSAMDLASPNAPQTMTGTNNQVAQVDEADFVKFNGKHIFQLHSGTLRILKAWPASELNQIASLSLKGHPQEMLVNDITAVVLASHDQNVQATIVDISKPSQPRILTEFNIPGQYRTARLIGQTLRIVNQDFDSFESIWGERAIQSSNSWLQDETAARKLNIRSTTQLLNGSERTLDMIKSCKNIFAPKKVAPTVLTRIITIDLKAKKYDETMAFIPAETVYASENAIYLSHTGYSQMQDRTLQQTAVHKFTILNGQTARYQASGVINGHLINQFAMDEHGGYLRVATNGTEYNEAKFLSPGQWQQISRVQILATENKVLKSVGQTPDLGRGERLYSVRFDGDKGYIVTFRQVDPLFTIDLKDPHHPRVIGELKVPGFSTYIHMLASAHLLTIGQDADEKTGRVRGLKLSVFDVSNFSKPREVKSLTFRSGVSSESSYEHKAFSFYPAKGILAIPATQGSRNSLLLFKVTTSNIQTAGELNMTDLNSVRRSFFADNFVYAIGGSGVRAAAFDNPQDPLATVQFDHGVAESQW